MFLKKSWFFFLPQTLTQKFSENGNTFRVRSLDCMNIVQKHTFGTCFSSFKNLICQFRDFIKNILKGLSRLLFMSPEHPFGRKMISSSRKMFFPCFSELQLNIPGYLIKKFRVGCPNCILRVQRNVFLKKNSFWETWKLFSSLSDFELRRLRNLLKKLPEGCQFFLRVVPRIFLGKKPWREENPFFQTLSEKCSDADRKFSAAF